MKKDERLHHRSLVEGLFRHGKSFYEFPLKVTWRMLTPGQMEANFRDMVPEGIGKLQMMVTVPKKKRKRAVDRVLMRRRIREAYRLNRMQLKEIVEANDEIRSMAVAFVYLQSENVAYANVECKMKNALARLCKIADKKKRE